MTHVPQDLLDRLARLERQVHQLTGRAHIRPAMDQVLNGAVVIGEGGSLDVRAPNDAQILGAGRFSTGRHGVSMAREDGTGVAFEVGGNSTTAEQMVRIYPREGYPSTPIVMDDAHADGYLGRPFVPIPLIAPADVASDTERTTHTALLYVQHRVLLATITVWAPANTTITAHLELASSSGYGQIGDPFTVVGGASGQEISSTQRIPIDRPHGERWRVLLRAARTAGTGTGTIWPSGLWGTHTINAEEA
ncbi:hypothetical protein [Streptomyces chryseus]